MPRHTVYVKNKPYFINVLLYMYLFQTISLLKKIKLNKGIHTYNYYEKINFNFGVIITVMFFFLFDNAH